MGHPNDIFKVIPGGMTAPCTIHDLFNELQRRLEQEGNNSNDDHVRYVLTKMHASKVDELHHDYTDLTETT